VFDVERIRRLVELMKEHDLREIDLCEAEQKIRIARGPAGAPVVYPSMPAPALATVAAAAQSGASTGPAGPVDGPNIVLIKSPMVGTYYCRPNPKAESFVKVGDFVEPNSRTKSPSISESRSSKWIPASNVRAPGSRSGHPTAIRLARPLLISLFPA
jgi:biotin carboxyl carrier protein